MSELVERLPEPAVTAHLRGLIGDAQQRFTARQRADMQRWSEAHVLESAVVDALRRDHRDATALRRHADELVRRRRGEPSAAVSDHLGRVPRLLEHAARHPSAVSAILWTWLGAAHPHYASHLLQLVRDRAGLPGLRLRLFADDPMLAAAEGKLAALVDRFADRQVDDGVLWIEQVPPPFGVDDHATLSRQHVALEQARAAAPRLPAARFANFARLAASFLVQLSVQGLDSLGFPLARDVQLDVDPPLPRRLEIAAWARRAGRQLSPAGALFVVGIAVEAPWPLRLELIAGDLGRGACGGLGLLLRLHGDGPVAVSQRAPVLLAFASEPPEELGPRFERWLEAAYPHATEAWRRWC